MEQAVVFRNRWRDVFDGRIPEEWTPRLSVSIVIAAYNSRTLPLTLASIAAQNYPQELLEVIVVDDGSDPPVELGEIIPENLTLIRVTDGWGRSNAAQRGIERATGDIIYWLDADMVLARDNVREHAKWAHWIPEAATIGEKTFVTEWDQSPGDIHRQVADGTIGQQWRAVERDRHWSESVYAETDDLNDSDGRHYSTHMGACATVTRAVWERTRGQDTRLHLGEDTEIAYRIWQAGGVFVPAKDARSWHLGRATITEQRERVTAINDVFFAQRMPIPHYRRTAQNRVWEVPLIRAVVHVDSANAGYGRTCVDLLLNSTLTDVAVDVVADWGSLSDDRRRVLDDPDVELRLLREWFRGDGRVRCVDAEVPVSPSPYLLEIPAHVGLSSDTLRSLYASIDGSRAGAVAFVPAEDVTSRVVLWSTAARARAAGVPDSDSLWSAVDSVWGVATEALDGEAYLDLRVVDRPARIFRREPRILALEQERRALIDRARAAEAALSAAIPPDAGVRRHLAGLVGALGRLLPWSRARE